jgi:hypothetical protein
MRWTREIFIDFLCVVFQFPIDEPDSRLPWYISAVFCLVVPVLAIGIWLVVHALI